MSEGKRYYWLRLQDNFFSSKRIKKLRKMAGGDTYTIIYLKMQLLAMKTDGVLTFTGLESEFADELALDLDEDPVNVKATLVYLISCGLCETSDNISFLLPWAVANTGSETSAAKRMRDMRERNNVTPMLRDRYGEKDKRDTDTVISKEIEGCGGKETSGLQKIDFSTGFQQGSQHISEDEFEALREKALRRLQDAK